MKNKKSAERSDIAIISWKEVSNFYKNNPEMLYFVEYVKNRGLDSKLHASTSHYTLNISPRHRYDAKVRTISIYEYLKSIKLCVSDENGGKEVELDLNMGEAKKEFEKRLNELIELYEI